MAVNSTCKPKNNTVSRKAYIIDNNFINAFSWRAGQDRGKLLENLVALELRKQDLNLQFTRGKQECDFIVETPEHTLLPIQVSYELGAPDTRAREVKGLLTACHATQAREGLIVTMAEEETFTEDGVNVRVVPAWKWLLQGVLS